MAQTLKFVIYPDSQQTSLDLFQKAIEDIRRFIIDVDYAVTRERGGRHWVIESLHSSNPEITVRNVLENEELTESIFDGIASINKGTSDPPKHLYEPSLQTLKRMRRLFRGKDKASRLGVTHGDESTEIDKNIGERVDRILRGGYSAMGAIEGVLEAVNLHGERPTFTIWDRVRDVPIRCYFPKDKGWIGKIEGLLEKQVSVRGQINYFKNGVPRSIVAIEHVNDETPNPDLPKAGFGSLSGKDRIDNMVDFLRRVREGV